MEEKIKKKVRYILHPAFIQEVLKLQTNNSTRVLFFLIDKMSSDHDQKSWWAKKKMAKLLNISENTLLKSISELEKLNFISIQKRFDAESKTYQTNIYRVNPRYITKTIETEIYFEENILQNSAPPTATDCTTPLLQNSAPPTATDCTQSIILNEHLDLKNSSEVNYVEEKNLENSTEKTWESPNIKNSTFKQKEKVEIISKELKEFIDYWNQSFGTRFKYSPAIQKNLTFWLKHHSMEDIFEAISMLKYDTFWRTKLDPTSFLRQKNPSGENVDRIDQFKNLIIDEKEITKNMTGMQKVEYYRRKEARQKQELQNLI